MEQPINLRGVLAVIVSMTFLGCAQAGDIAVIMAPGAPPLSKDRLTSIYLGRNNDYKPIDQTDSSKTRVEFYKKATDRDQTQVKAVWARVAFTGLGTPPRQLADDAAVKKAVADDPKAIGYIDKAHVDATVTVVLELP